jgi:hypothetical protein
MAIRSVAIGTGNTTLYTSSGNNAVTTIMICNTATYDPLNPTAGLTYLDLHFVASTDGISSTNLVVNQLPVPAGETVTFDTEKIILANNDRVVASSASPANLVATISTLEV